jgi:hypothetical protein
MNRGELAEHALVSELGKVDKRRRKRAEEAKRCACGPDPGVRVFRSERAERALAEWRPGAGVVGL